MTDAEIQDYLDQNGYPPHIVKAGLAGLVRRWLEFVDEAENGYEFGLEDYRNDLDIRAILLLAGAESMSGVEDADCRLQALLTATEARVWESSAGDPWWDFGYPSNARGKLRRDLASAGLWQSPG